MLANAYKFQITTTLPNAVSTPNSMSTRYKQFWAVSALVATVAIGAWYFYNPQSVGPAEWIKSTNRKVVESGFWTWGYTVNFAPTTVHFPKNVGDIQAAVTQAAHLRVVGGGHSFNSQIRTSDTLLDLRHINHIRLNGSKVTVGAGATVRQLQHYLVARQLNVHGFGGGSHQQSMAGAISTNLHGAQPLLFAQHITKLSLVLANGTNLNLTADDTVFHAAKSGMGLLGVIHEVELQTHPRVCLQIQTADATIEYALSQLTNNVIGEFKTTSWGAAHNVGVLTVFQPESNTAKCPPDFPLTEKTDFWPTFVHDNVVSLLATLFTFIVDSELIYKQVTANYKSYHNKLIGLELGWRADIAPMFGLVFTEYAIPKQQCYNTMQAIVDSFQTNGFVLTAMTVKVLQPENATLLAYAPQESCALEVYYLPHQKGLRNQILAVQRIVFEAGGRSHLGKIYIDSERPIYHRLNDTAPQTFETMVDTLDATGKFKATYSQYTVDYDKLHGRAVAFRVLVASAAITVAVATVLTCVRCCNGRSSAYSPLPSATFVGLRVPYF